MNMKKSLAGFLIIFGILSAYAQSITTTGVNGITPDAFLNNNFAGEGVELIDCKFNWSSGAINGSQVGTFTNTNPSFPFSSGILLTTGNISVAQGPNNSGGESSTTGVNQASIDPDLQQLIPNYSLSNASVLEFNFYSGRNENSNVVSFNYIFGSEEYPEYVCSNFNDVFAFFLTGPDPFNCQGASVTRNIAIIPGSGNLPVAINTLNSGQPGGGYSASGCESLNYSQYYYNNVSDAVQYDAYTAYLDPATNHYVGLTAQSLVCPCTEYKMKITISNVGDNAFDSGVFLEQGSFKVPKLLTIDDNTSNHNDSIIRNCNHADINIHYGEQMEPSMSIMINTNGGTANQEDFNLIYIRSNNTRDTVHNGDFITFPEGDTLVSLLLEISEAAHFNPGQTKTVQIVFKSILCSSFKYLDGHVEERAQYDTLTYVLVDNQLFTLANDTIFYCDQCNHVAIHMEGGTEPLIYNWTPSAGLANPHARESDCNLTSNTTFQVTVSDRWGCLVDTCYHTALITSTPELEGHYRISPNVICVPEEVEFSSSATPASIHEWIIFNDNMSDTIYGANQTYTFTDPGHYSITYHAYEAIECDASLTLINYINAGNQPTALFSFDPAEAEVGQTVIFTNESEGQNVHYQWSFGDGSNSSEENPVHVYNSENSENYNVILTVTDNAGCEDSYTLPVPVVDNHVLYVPNSFTPNKDGNNDIFLPIITNVAKYSIVIYDRKGGIVFATDNTEVGWDGKNSNGQELPSGIYTYMIKYVRYNNLKQELIKTGSINLIR